MSVKTDMGTWTSKSIGSRFQHNFFYFIIRIGGRHVAYAILYFIVLYYVTFVPSIKKKTEPYLSKIYPQDSSIKRFFHRFKLVLQFGKTLVDRAIVGILGVNSIHASFSNDEDIKKLYQFDSGFILMMSHVGCWQVAMSALNLLQKPVNLLMLTEDENIDKHFYEHSGDGKAPFNIINPEDSLGAAIEMINALKNGEILCVMGDRVFGVGGESSFVSVSFLNSMANFPSSAYIIASLVQKPIVVLNSYKTDFNSYQIEISDIINMPKKIGKSQEDVKPYVEMFVKTLEKYVEEHPYQFFNFYDMWDI